MIHIRESEDRDLSQISRLCADFSKEIAPQRQTVLQAADFLRAARTILEKHGRIYVATRKPEVRILGFMAIAEREALISGGSYLELTDLYVTPNERFKGVGSELIQHAKKVCRSRSISRLTLYTGEPDHSTSPNTIYRHHGFEFIGPTFRVLV